MNQSAFIKVDKETFYRLLQNAGEHERLEYVRGRVMQQRAGGTLRHSMIARRLATTLERQLDTAHWIVTNGSDRGVETDATVRLPDVVVEPVGADLDGLATTQPVLIVEVLSKSSEDRDLDVKPAEYLSIPCLRAYIVASQDEPACLVYLRQGGGSFAADPIAVSGLSSRIDIPALSLSIPLDEIYRGLTDAG